METNDKLMTLLRLMDEPEAMTEAQLEELLSDEEVRKAYDVMADVVKRGLNNPGMIDYYNNEIAAKIDDTF